MLKDVPTGFETWPVGPGKPATTGGGMLTKFVPPGKRFAGATPVLPVIVKRLDVAVPWFEIQKGLPGRFETPHVLTRFGSVMVARPEMSEARFVCLNCA